MRGNGIAQGGALQVHQRALLGVHEVCRAFHAGLDEARFDGISTTDADALQFGDAHGLLEGGHVGIIRRGGNQDCVFRFQDLLEECRCQRVLAKAVVRFVHHHADAQALIAQRFNQRVDRGVGVALLADVAFVLHARGHGLPGGDKDIATATHGRGAVICQFAQAQAVKLLAQHSGGLADHALERGEPEPDNILFVAEAFDDGTGH